MSPMAQSFLNRLPEHADATERMVAEKLALRDADWMVRWGYFYEDGRRRTSDREGDFIVLGPDGRARQLLAVVSVEEIS